MKVLFAVNDDNISTEIVKKYQKEYKEIISYKNVYFYNAILKEIQRDKTYDRIVISEDLEEFTSSSYEQRDKFIFEKLDDISDEALDAEQDNISIILICSERRNKSDDILIKLFGIGIYNAILGNDRSIDQVCQLINKPRSKKQAKIYYNIETEDVNYRPENEDDVNEEEMRNILNHFKKLGRNEDKYIQSFNNIVSQYNEKQLKVIISVLPLSVKAVLEEKSPEYQRIATLNGMMSKTQSSRKKINKINGPSEKLLISDKMNKLSRPVVVPTTMGVSNVKTVMTKKIKPAVVTYQDSPEDGADDDFEEIEMDEVKPKKRGRPRKNAEQGNDTQEKAPKKRGRPKKQKEESVPDFENELKELLPGFDDEQLTNNNEEQDDADEMNILPGFDNVSNEDAEEDVMLPMDADDTEEQDFGYEDDSDNSSEAYTGNNTYQQYQEDNYSRNNYKDIEENSYEDDFDEMEFAKLLTSEKKVVSFLGTTKNGTSFIVNSVAEVLSKAGVNVAILDATQNKNDYYIYTKNDESLRRTAVNSYQNLIIGNPYGVQVNPNLTVYTGIPTDTESINNFGSILKTLVKNHTCVLIDCDFKTPTGFFKNSQEIYLVQNMDVLTIQPLTAFLRELKSKNILDSSKINIIVNKVVKLKGITTKNIIGGMAFYNDPEMSFMTELFDRNTVKYTEVPFYEEIYSTYLSGIANDCEISSNNYPKEFKNIINTLSRKIYGLAPRQASYNNKKGKNKSEPSYANSFSSSMSNTLNNMRKNY